MQEQPGRPGLRERQQEQREQSGLAEAAMGIDSIDADDPRFKLAD